MPQGRVDHRMRAPGSGYHGGPTATSGKGPPQDLGAGRTAPPKAKTVTKTVPAAPAKKINIKA